MEYSSSLEEQIAYWHMETGFQCEHIEDYVSYVQIYMFICSVLEMSDMTKLGFVRVGMGNWVQ